MKASRVRALSEEEKEQEMNQFLWADCILCENALHILNRRLQVTAHLDTREQIESTIRTQTKKRDNRMKYMDILEEIYSLTDLLDNDTISEQERIYFTQRRQSIRDNLSKDKLYNLIWEYHVKLNEFF